MGDVFVFEVELSLKGLRNRKERFQRYKDCEEISLISERSNNQYRMFQRFRHTDIWHSICKSKRLFTITANAQL